MKGLFTIGYEGASLADFVRTLTREGVTTLLDVRELPLSRRKGFSKTSLAELLTSRGIAYRHERALGTPRPLRRSLAVERDYPAFFAAFGAHLDSHSRVLEELSASLEGRVALMCFERDHKACHRSSVADRLKAITGLPVRHLEVTHVPAEAGESRDLGQSVPAAEPKVRRDRLLCGDHA
ncbi:DUF488 family protein [Piscinibacter koreensis]|uniref:DUF488 domain-containing protein n=1 Tax=Piscinibacter koreensis TaxID=2742824 RepID=A0A7Y6NT93_9BURK|nr:DUF488 domain-containing protein [Schlegelella koreensis]NUZ08937.1 DUF488 domain-containing protein [Schlegelella koreensis]